MAYRRKARSTRRRPTKSRRSYKPTVRRQVASVLRRQTETKMHITTGTESGLSITTGGVVLQPLVGLVNGTTKFTRVGNHISPVGLDLRGHVNIGSNGTYLVRMMVIRKLSPNDSFTSNGLEDDTGNYGPVSNTLSDIYARVNVDRYKMLYNKVMTISNASDIPSVRLFKHYVPIKYKVQYDDAAGTPAQGQTQVIFICRDANNDAVSGSAELNYNFKFYFKDA